MTEHVVVGMRDAWDREESVSLSTKDRRHHVYIIGKSGTGKTTLLRNMILQDIAANRGVGIIDPHGDLAEDLLDHIPRHRTEHVVYFDPSDPDHCIGFNILHKVPPERRHLVASGVVNAFKSVYPDFFGPRMEYIFYAAVAALLDCENVTLLGLQRMLTDDGYRAWVVKQIKDPVVRHFWESEFEAHDRRMKAEMVSPILNKIGPMLMSPQLRNLLGQVKSRICPRFMMDHGRIFIANLAKGKLGADKASILGAFLVTQFELAALSRADTPEHERQDFFLFVDEFQTLVSDSFSSILSEARKYRLCLTLSHQYLDQLKTEIHDAVMGNVGSLITFRVGHKDAKILYEAFGETYEAKRLSSLNNGEICTKLLCNGRDQEPFFARTFPPQGERHGRGATIIRRSRERFCELRVVVENRIRRWFGSH